VAGDCRFGTIRKRIIVVAREEQHHCRGQDADDQQASHENGSGIHGMPHRITSESGRYHTRIKTVGVYIIHSNGQPRNDTAIERPL